MTFTVTGGAPSVDLVNYWGMYLQDFSGDYLAFRTGSATDNNIAYILLFGDTGSITETQTGYAFDGVQLVSLASMSGSSWNNLVQHVYTASGTVENPDSVIVWSSLGVAPRLQTGWKQREGGFLCAFSALLLGCVCLCAWTFRAFSGSRGQSVGG